LLVAFSALGWGESCHDTQYYINNFASAKDPETFNLVWARCEKELGHSEKALSAYERVLLYNPHNTEAITAIVPLYRATGMNEDAKRVLEGIDTASLGEAERKEIEKLRNDSTFEIVSRFDAALEYGYDTNINYNIFAEDTILPESKPQASPFYTIDLAGSFSHSFEGNDALSIQSHIGLYYKDNREGDYFDIAHGKFDIGMGYDTSSFSLYLPLVYERMHYLGRDLYGQYGVAPRITMSVGDEMLLNLGLKYLQRDYINGSDQNADDTLTSASVGVYRFFGDDFLYAQFDYGLNEADATVPASFSGYHFINLFAGASHELKGYHIVLAADYLYSKRFYDDPVSAAATVSREDEYQQLKLSLKRKIDNHWTMKFEYSYLDNSSNYPTIDYDKNIMLFGFQYNY